MEKPDNLFQDLSLEQREEALKGMATTSEYSRVRRHYTKEEMEDKYFQVVQESTSVMEQTEAFKKIQKEFTAEVKKCNMSIKETLLAVKRGYSDNEEMLYGRDDQDAGLMHFFDKQGVYVHSRALLPEERQTKIYDLQKTGTND